MTEAPDLSFIPVENPTPKLLTRDQVDHYNEHGYVRPLKIFDDAEVVRNREYFDSLLSQIEAAHEGRDSYSVNGFHRYCRGLYDLTRHPVILDYVEDILGPNFLAWGTHYFCKLPHDEKKVPWHQDASYWPFNMSRTVTVWLAIDDVDEENAAMQFVPGTHRMGPLEWKNASGPAVLYQEIQEVESYGKPVSDTLKAGEISLHADMLAHGSLPNHSSRRRCGLTIRYCPPEVKRTTEDWTNEAVQCRGEDPYGHWNYVERPEDDIVPAP